MRLTTPSPCHGTRDCLASDDVPQREGRSIVNAQKGWFVCSHKKINCIVHKHQILHQNPTISILFFERLFLHHIHTDILIIELLFLQGLVRGWCNPDGL